MTALRPGDDAFSSAIPQIYDEHFVPMIFEPYARDLVDRVLVRAPTRVLELAAGTGVVTRQLATRLPGQVSIVATDLNQAMLDRAAAVGTARPVEWRRADAMALPFDAATFDLVVCQFGVMFFPDRAHAYAEARRVLRPGGTFLFNTWDRLADNHVTRAVMEALAEIFPDNPPTFMTRIPHGYHDHATIESDLVAGGFATPTDLVTVSATARAPSASIAALALCQGTPMAHEILARDPRGLGPTTQSVTERLERRFATGPVEGKMQAIVVTATPDGTDR
jgi:SAM-dependent methyltransferase